MRVTELEIPDLVAIDAPGIDLETRRELLRAAAEESWIARNIFGFSLLHYDDAVAVLRDKRWHNAVGQLLQLSGITNPEWLARQRTSLLSAEGDEHLRLRRLVGPSFTPRHADALRPFMRDVASRLADQLVDGFRANGHADFAVDFCEEYPIPIICELFGAPSSDWRLFSAWANDIFRVFNRNLASDIPVILAAQEEMNEYLVHLIAERRADPRDDLLSSLIAAEEQGDRLTADELIMICEAVLLAGTDTTRNQLGCAVSLFANHPDQWALLAAHPELAPQAVEESMRYFGTVRATGRIASEDIEYRDVLFPRGTFIAPLLAQANRDSSVFDEPDSFDITRPPFDRPQLTFGSGIHYCLGASLARAELQEALVILSQRLPHLELDGAPTWKALTVGIFGPEHLPIRFTPQ